MGNPVPGAHSWILSSLPVIDVLLGSQLEQIKIFKYLRKPWSEEPYGKPCFFLPSLLDSLFFTYLIAVLLESQLEKIQFFLNIYGNPV